jgi:hypothetical protein
VLIAFGLNEYADSSTCDCALSKCGCNVYNNGLDDDDDINADALEFTPSGHGISISEEERIVLDGMPDDIFDRDVETIFEEVGC